MKNMIVFSLLVAGGLMLGACSTEYDENSNEPIVSQSKMSANKTLTELHAFNNQFISERPLTRSNWWKNLQVARADYTWGKRGAKAGQVIAGIAGAATGGSGYAITVGVSAGVIGGYASYRKWQQLYPNEEGASVSYQSAMNKMENLFDSNYHNNTLNSLGSDNYAAVGVQINLPRDFEFLRRIGNDHNKVLEELRRISLASPRRSSIEEPYNPGLQLSPIAELFEDEELLSTSGSVYTAITTTSDGDSAASVSLVVDSIIDSFDTLLNSSNLNDTELVFAINNYISIIENNNELSYSEKVNVYSTLIIALYSIQYWNDNL